jgi:hypothetical protein
MKPTMEEAYLEDKIDKVLPTIDDVCEGMSRNTSMPRS